MKRKYEAIHKEVERLDAKIKELKGNKGIDKELVDKLKGSQIYFGNSK